MFVHSMCAVPVEARRGYHIPLELNLQMVVTPALETEPRSSARTTSLSQLPSFRGRIAY